MTQQPKKLRDQVRDAIRRKHYAYRTENTYVSWIRQYILFHKNGILRKWVLLKSKPF